MREGEEEEGERAVLDQHQEFCEDGVETWPDSQDCSQEERGSNGGVRVKKVGCSFISVTLFVELSY